MSNTLQQKDALWASLDSALSRVSSSDYLRLLRDANARTGIRIGEKGCKIIAAYGRNARASDSNGTSLLRFVGDNKLAHVNTIFSVPKEYTSRTFNGTWPMDRKRLDYIITRQPHPKLVRNAPVHLQPRTDSNHSIVCVTLGRSARSLQQRVPRGIRVLMD